MAEHGDMSTAKLPTDDRVETNSIIKDNTMSPTTISRRNASAVSASETQSNSLSATSPKEAVSKEAQDDSTPSWQRRLPIIIALSMAVFLSSLDATIVATIVPTLADDFKSVNDIGWYGSA